MLRYLALAVCPLLLIQAGAQDQDSESDDVEIPYAYAYIRPDPGGRVRLQVATGGLTADQNVRLRRSVPAALGCEWTPGSNSEDTFDGICRNWLRAASPSGAAALPTASLLQALRNAGAQEITLSIQLKGQPIPAPRGWRAAERNGRKNGYYTFNSMAPGDAPADFPVSLETAVIPSQLLIPMLLVLLVPGAMAYAIRMRATGAVADEKVNWLVWMNWINLATWLYWITAIRPDQVVEFAVRAGINTYLPSLGLGVLMFAGPPILAMAASFAAMAPLISGSDESFSLLFNRKILGEASILVPLGIFLIGEHLSSAGIGYPMISLVAAYVVYRGFAWVNWNLTYGEAVPLDSGTLFERAAALARKAGVPLARLSLLKTRIPEEANAFATSGDAVVLTTSLVNGLTEREVDAVIAHELGHHKSGHLRVNYATILFWVYILLAGPLYGWLLARYEIPSWVVTLPIAPVVFTLVQGLLSQRHEYTADARAVEITGDPEGKIAALGRLAQLSRVPVQSGGMMDSIMSHPSMQRRVLALARSHGMVDGRALDILRNPDLAYSDPPQMCRAEAPAQVPSVEPVFTVRERVLFCEQLRWIKLLTTLGATVAVGAAIPASFYFTKRILIPVMFGTVAAFALTIWAEIGWSARFASRMRRRLSPRVDPAAGAVFTGLHPGRGVLFTEGFPDWDFGFVSLEGDWLCYRGERARFAVPRQAVLDIRVVKGSIRWIRERRVQVVFRGGAFTVNPYFARPTLTRCRRIVSWLQKWADQATTSLPLGPPPEPEPALPPLPGMETTRLDGLWLTCKWAGKFLFAGCVIIPMTYRWAPAMMFVPFCAALIGAVRELPNMIWPVRRPRPPVQCPLPVPRKDTVGVG